MSKLLIAVVGGTGTQGGSVVDALLERGKYAVRVLTRNPESDKAQALVARGAEVVAADLNDRSSLATAFSNVYGAFLVTNSFDPSNGVGDTELGKLAVAAAREAGVQHAIWSTLPNSMHYSDGKLAVPHFTGKALVDAAVAEAGFRYHTFVVAPFYYQNFTGMLQPQPLGDGRTGWGVPMDPGAQVIQIGDISDFGRVVTRAFEEPEQAHGKRLAVAAQRASWNDIVSELNALGHDFSVAQLPVDVFDGLFPGAPQIRETYQWFEQYGYLGPDGDRMLAQTRQVYPEALTSFGDWAAANMPAAK